jgi:hypothetical protein
VDIAVFGVWIAMAVYVGTLVTRSVVDCPYRDDFAFIDQMTGDAPITWQWLWELHNEHRMPIPKLTIVYLTRLWSIDFRVAPLVSVALLAATSLACIWALARRRGRYAIEDALIPVVFCTWAQSESLTWTTTLQLVLAACFGMLWWCAARRAEETRRASWLAVAGVLGVCAGLSGGSGVALLAGFIPWFVWRAVADRATALRVMALVSAIALTCLGWVYAASYVPIPGHPGPPSLGLGFRYGLRLLASPWTMLGDIAEPVGLAVACFIAWSCWRIARTRSYDAASTIALTVGALAVCGAVTIGRAAGESHMVTSRYVTMMLPAALAIFALVAEAAATNVHRTTVVLMFGLVVVMFPAADRVGHLFAGATRKRLQEARTELRRGAPVDEVVVAYDLFPSAEYAVPRLEMLKRVHGSLYRGMPDVVPAAH